MPEKNKKIKKIAEIETSTVPLTLPECRLISLPNQNFRSIALRYMIFPSSEKRLTAFIQAINMPIFPLEIGFYLLKMVISPIPGSDPPLFCLAA
jgi:hypothetical protein